MKNVLLLAIVGLLVATTACQKAQPPDTRAADEQAIRAATVEWDKASQAKDLEKFLSFYAEETAVFPQGMPIATGPAAIRETLAKLFEMPGFALSIATGKVDVAKSGDLAYEAGTYQLTLNDAKGNPVATPGKYVVVWKKQIDGSWKAVADIFNSDQ